MTSHMNKNNTVIEITSIGCLSVPEIINLWELRRKSRHEHYQNLIWPFLAEAKERLRNCTLLIWLENWLCLAIKLNVKNCQNVLPINGKTHCNIVNKQTKKEEYKFFTCKSTNSLHVRAKFDTLRKVSPKTVLPKI